ncbi:hypothetical protein SESBI_11222 [Sesbania bispinosa]|nr:hypothetical protein SESBI_11222 [Sesbania bispinosa]
MTHPLKELQRENLRAEKRLIPPKELPKTISCSSTRRQQLEDFFEKNIKIYPFLTRAFCVAASMEMYGERTPRIRSWLKGKEMVLDIELICKFTDFKAEGILLYNENDWMEIANVSKDEVGKVLFSKGKVCTEVRRLTDLAKLVQHHLKNPYSKSKVF